MTARMTLDPVRDRDVMAAMMNLTITVRRAGLDHSLIELVKIRISQINGCGYCIDMHTKDARAAGESEQRLHLLSAWREASIYSERERAALAWAESVTRLVDQRVPDEIYECARQSFSEQELSALTLLVVEINGWNRFAIAFRYPAGNYEPGSVAQWISAIRGESSAAR